MAGQSRPMGKSRRESWEWSVELLRENKGGWKKDLRVQRGREASRVQGQDG